MFDSGNSEVFATIIAISVIVFFGVTALVNLARTTPEWTRAAIGVSALILAIAALLAILR